MAHVFVGHVDIFVFVGAHPVGDGFQGVFHAHRPQGWARTKKRSLAILIKTSMGRSNRRAIGDNFLNQPLFGKRQGGKKIRHNYCFKGCHTDSAMNIADLSTTSLETSE